MAYQGHIIIPTTHDRAGDVIDIIERGLAIRFGGYSRYDGTGGWHSGGSIITEDHVRLVVNTTDEDRFNYEQFKDYLRIEAEYIKDRLDESAVLIEIHELDMELV